MKREPGSCQSERSEESTTTIAGGRAVKSPASRLLHFEIRRSLAEAADGLAVIRRLGMTMAGKVSAGAFVALSAALLAGCSVLPETQPDLTRYYVLTSPPARAETPVETAAPIRVLLRPVVAAEFLRSQIMPVRVGDNELRFVDQARWAEPIEAALTRVLTERLAQVPGVRVFDRRGESHDYDVSVRVSHCEGVLPAGVARLAAHIEIFSADLNPKLVAQADFSVDEPGWNGKDHGDLAKKLSEAAEALGARIGEMLMTRNK